MKRSLTTLLALSALASAGCSLINTFGTGVPPGDVGAQSSRPVGFVYTTLYGKNAVLEINNPQSRANPDPIIVPNGPRALAIDPRNIQQYMYVVCELADTVAVVDRRSRQVIRSISVGHQPRAIALTPGGERAFVTNSADDTVSVIDLSSNSTVATLQLNTFQTTQPLPVGTTPAQAARPTALKPMGIASNATGTHIYVACAGGYMIDIAGTVPTKNTATGAVAGGNNYSPQRNVQLTGSVSPLNIAVASDGANDSIFVSDPSGNKVFVVNQTAAATPLQVPGEPWGVAVGKNPQTGRPDRLYITQRSSGGLAQYTLPDLSGGTGANVEGSNPESLAVSSLGDEIYVSVTGQNNVAVLKRGANGTLSRPEYFNINTLNQQFVTSTGDIALGGFLLTN